MADHQDHLADCSGAPIERPLPLPTGNALFGSDVVAETLRALEIPFIALNPGASYRGFHDSLVNHLGNVQPQMLLCLHEEHAVAIAHGYAKVTGRPMAAAVHSNVGLMHATMAIFNAWCDRMPVLVLGATGPVDAPKRRPWIDWIHTARDQGALVRPYTKWDDQPASPQAAREALLRACWLAQSAPMGRSMSISTPACRRHRSRIRCRRSTLPDLSRTWRPLRRRRAADAGGGDAAGAKQPVILMGRGSRSEQAWVNRVALAEALSARVVTDLKSAPLFPTDHPLHAGAPATFPVQEAAQAIAAARCNPEPRLGGSGRGAEGRVRRGSPAAKVINVSLDHLLHNGWSMDHQALPPADLFIAADAGHRDCRLCSSDCGGRPRIVPRRRLRCRNQSATQARSALPG